MGYWAEKLKVEKKMKILKRVLLGVLLSCILALCIFSAFVPPESWKYYMQKPNISKRKEGELRLHFLSVGQGDCAILELPDGKMAMIDGGDGSGTAERKILRYLNALHIDTIDYLLLTHAEKDHFGGLAEVLKYKGVKYAYLPPCAIDENEEYASFYASLMKTQCAWEYTSRITDSLSSYDENYPYTVSFLSPYSQDVTSALETGKYDANALSAVLWLDYQGVSALFTGDITPAVERDLIRDDALGVFTARGASLRETEILKVPHHGGVDSVREDFLSYLGAETAILSCGEDNAYGHPTAETLERLRKANMRICRTDERGDIVITISPNGSYEVSYIA